MPRATENARTIRHARLLWAAQTLLALIFLFAGGMKLVTPVAELARMTPLALPVSFLRFIGTAEVLGAAGLILPGLLRVTPELTVLAAAGLTVIMTGATVVTLLAHGGATALVPAVIGVIAALVAAGRRAQPASIAYDMPVRSPAC